KPREQFVLARRDIGLRQTQTEGNACLNGHSDRHGIPMRQGVVQRRFEGMPNRVTVIEENPVLTEVALIAGDNLRLERNAAGDDVQQDAFLQPLQLNDVRAYDLEQRGTAD